MLGDGELPMAGVMEGARGTATHHAVVLTLAGRQVFATTAQQLIQGDL